MAEPVPGTRIDAEPRVRLVSLQEHGFRTRNYHWIYRNELGLSEEELAAYGVTSEDILVHPDVVQPLARAGDILRTLWKMELAVKEGYRAPGLYRRMYELRVAKHGRAFTDSIMNMDAKPHATGLVVDVTAGYVGNRGFEEYAFRDRAHDEEGGLHVGFYRRHPDPAAHIYERRQRTQIETMESVGFQLGVRREYFHFELGDVTEAPRLEPHQIGG